MARALKTRATSPPTCYLENLLPPAQSSTTSFFLSFLPTSGSEEKSLSHAFFDRYSGRQVRKNHERAAT